MESTADLARSGRTVFAPRRVGRPGHGALYWPLFAVAQAARARWSVHVRGRDLLAPGPAILVGNHLRAVDPALLGLAVARRMVFVAKAEAFTGPVGALLRGTGQIPLVRGDEATTRWALAASAAVLAEGRVLVVYPEATRSPDGRSLHRLHRRVLLPLLAASPDVPVHAVTIGYSPSRGPRERVDLRLSPPLPVDVATMSDDDITSAVRDALLGLGGMPYIDRFGTAVKSARARDDARASGPRP